jgi:hypothetical protein
LASAFSRLVVRLRRAAGLIPAADAVGGSFPLLNGGGGGGQES